MSIEIHSYRLLLISEVQRKHVRISYITSLPNITLLRLILQEGHDAHPSVLLEKIGVHVYPEQT